MSMLFILIERAIFHAISRPLRFDLFFSWEPTTTPHFYACSCISSPHSAARDRPLAAWCRKVTGEVKKWQHVEGHTEHLQPITRASEKIWDTERNSWETLCHKWSRGSCWHKTERKSEYIGSGCGTSQKEGISVLEIFVSCVSQTCLANCMLLSRLLIKLTPI